MSVTITQLDKVLAGSWIRLSVTTTDLAGAAADASALDLILGTPINASTGRRTTTSKAIGDWTHAGTGSYHLDVLLDVAGDWLYQIHSVVGGKDTYLEVTRPVAERQLG